MTYQQLNGLIAATYTPFDPSGNVNTDVIAQTTEHLLQSGVTGLYVCGSTGEGMSLSTQERMLVTQSYVDAAANRVPVIAQIGHNSLSESQHLAEHAAQIGVSAISATCPSYYKIDCPQLLVDSMASIANAAPEVPFYYYHIPALTGSSIDMVDFLQRGRESIDNLAGLKYTDTKLFEFQECLEKFEGQLDVVWGCDEMLLGALATGAKAAIGSTYNVAAPLYNRLINQLDKGNLVEARRLQSRSIQMIRTLNHFPFHAAMKSLLTMRGIEMGACRLPLAKLSSDDRNRLRSELESIDYFDWAI